MNPSFLTVDEAVDWIHGKRYKGQKNGLENTVALLRELGNPESGLRLVHVAGTNGKGSTCAFLERAARENGLRTGLYTSPYLIRYSERVRVMGQPIPDADLVRLTEIIRGATDALVAREIYPTAFEIGTALAFLYFREQKIDLGIIEVGLGGRFDSTNVITPAVCAIAAIGLDHMKLLGSTLPEIAFEKAGIIKSGVPVCVSQGQDCVMSVFRRAASERGSTLFEVPAPKIERETAYDMTFSVDLPQWGTVGCTISVSGAYQAENASLALAAAEKLGLNREKTLSGIGKMKWPCRLEWVDGVLIDGSHNPQGARTLSDYVTRFFPGRKISLVFAMMRDKDYAACAGILSPLCDRIYTTSVEESRSASPEELAAAAGNGAIPVYGVERALETARADGNLVICAGSLYLAGAVRRLLAGEDGSL